MLCTGVVRTARQVELKPIGCFNADKQTKTSQSQTLNNDPNKDCLDVETRLIYTWGGGDCKLDPAGEDVNIELWKLERPRKDSL